MSDQKLRRDLIRIASGLPAGSPSRRKLLAVLTASVDALSVLAAVRRAAKRGYWADAIDALRPLAREWGRGRSQMADLLASLEGILDDAAYDDTGQKAKQVFRILDRVEAAFNAGYPSLEGEKVLRGRRA